MDLFCESSDSNDEGVESRPEQLGCVTMTGFQAEDQDWAEGGDQMLVTVKTEENPDHLETEDVSESLKETEMNVSLGLSYTMEETASNPTATLLEFLENSERSSEAFPVKVELVDFEDESFNLAPMSMSESDWGQVTSLQPMLPPDYIDHPVEACLAKPVRKTLATRHLQSTVTKREAYTKSGAETKTRAELRSYLSRKKEAGSSLSLKEEKSKSGLQPCLVCSAPCTLTKNRKLPCMHFCKRCKKAYFYQQTANVSPNERRKKKCPTSGNCLIDYRRPLQWCVLCQVKKFDKVLSEKSKCSGFQSQLNTANCVESSKTRHHHSKVELHKLESELRDKTPYVALNRMSKKDLAKYGIEVKPIGKMETNHLDLKTQPSAIGRPSKRPHSSQEQVPEVPEFIDYSPGQQRLLKTFLSSSNSGNGSDTTSYSTDVTPNRSPTKRIRIPSKKVRGDEFKSPLSVNKTLENVHSGSGKKRRLKRKTKKTKKCVQLKVKRQDENAQRHPIKQKGKSVDTGKKGGVEGNRGPYRRRRPYPVLDHPPLGSKSESKTMSLTVYVFTCGHACSLCNSAPAKQWLRESGYNMVKPMDPSYTQDEETTSADSPLMSSYSQTAQINSSSQSSPIPESQTREIISGDLQTDHYLHTRDILMCNSAGNSILLPLETEPCVPPKPHTASTSSLGVNNSSSIATTNSIPDESSTSSSKNPVSITPVSQSCMSVIDKVIKKYLQKKSTMAPSTDQVSSDSKTADILETLPVSLPKKGFDPPNSSNLAINNRQAVKTLPVQTASVSSKAPSELKKSRPIPQLAQTSAAKKSSTNKASVGDPILSLSRPGSTADNSPLSSPNPTQSQRETVPTGPIIKNIFFSKPLPTSNLILTVSDGKTAKDILRQKIDAKTPLGEVPAPPTRQTSSSTAEETCPSDTPNSARVFESVTNLQPLEDKIKSTAMNTSTSVGNTQVQELEELDDVLPCGSSSRISRPAVQSPQTGRAIVSGQLGRVCAGSSNSCSEESAEIIFSSMWNLLDDV